jgi:hypothetical protein
MDKYYEEQINKPLNEIWYSIEWYDEDGDLRQSEVRADYYADKWVIANNFPSHNIIKELNGPSKQNLK